MKGRPEGFLAKDKIDHDGEIFDYIKELTEYLRRFTSAVLPDASGNLRDYVDEAVQTVEQRELVRRACDGELHTGEHEAW